MKKQIMLSVFALLLTACTTTITPVATGGSRADGVVEFTYQYGHFQKPVINWDAAHLQALQRCAAWDYNGAEMFGGFRQECAATNGYGACMATKVTATYQCTGRN